MYLKPPLQVSEPLQRFIQKKNTKNYLKISKTRPATTENPYKYLFNAHLFDIYKSDKYMAGCIFYQQCNDRFTIVKENRFNYILFASSLL